MKKVEVNDKDILKCEARAVCAFSQRGHNYQKKSWRLQRQIPKSLTAIIRPLSTPLIKPKIHVSLSPTDTEN